MIEKKPVNAAVTERDAFPIRKSIIAGILSLILIRYIFGLIPLAYPIDKEHVEFYYRGQVVSLAAPEGYCYTGQSDWIENILQISKVLLHFEDLFKFISFRSFRECKQLYNDEYRIYGYHRYFSPRFYFEHDMKDASPGMIGIAGMGAELLPLTTLGVNAWIESEGLKKSIQASIWSSKILSYFPQFDGYDESFKVIEEDTKKYGNGYCNVAIASFLKIDYGFEELFDRCNKNGQCSEAINDFLTGMQDHLNARRNNYEDRKDMGGFVKLAFYVIPFEGRSIYYGFAKETQSSIVLLDKFQVFKWGEDSCQKAQQISNQGLNTEKGERGLINFSR